MFYRLFLNISLKKNVASSEFMSEEGDVYKRLLNYCIYPLFWPLSPLLMFHRHIFWLLGFNHNPSPGESGCLGFAAAITLGYSPPKRLSFKYFKSFFYLKVSICAYYLWVWVLDLSLFVKVDVACPWPSKVEPSRSSLCTTCCSKTNQSFCLLNRQCLNKYS